MLYKQLRTHTHFFYRCEPYKKERNSFSIIQTLTIDPLLHNPKNMNTSVISINYTYVECIYHGKASKVDSTTIDNFDTFFLISTAICWTFGLALWSGALHYERFGGDPQKRSLGNRLISSGVITQACYIFTSTNFCQNSI